MRRRVILSVWLSVAALAGGVDGYCGHAAAEAAEPRPGTWMGGAALGFLSNTPMFPSLVQGIERSLSIDPAALEYFRLHIDLDVEHGRILEDRGSEPRIG